MSARDRYGELVSKVDAFFARVQARHGPAMQCGSGCHDCCHVQLTVTGVEADVIRAAVASVPPTTRARLASRAASSDAARCSALEDDGRCAIYAARPLVCRSHGVPIRQQPPAGAARIDSCFRNFTEQGPAAADADCILDQTTLSVVLLAIDSADADESGRAPGTRIPLTELLRA